MYVNIEYQNNGGWSILSQYLLIRQLNPVKEGPLDYAITENEIRNTAYILKTGKACGIDGISYEMIMCLLQNNPNVLVKLFNIFGRTTLSNVGQHRS